MTFVTVDRERNRLEALTSLLLSAFPGSVIYQQTDPPHVSRDIRETSVDAVFLQAENMDDARLLRVLRRGRPGLPMFFLVEDGEFAFMPMEENIRYLLRPVTVEKLRNALLR